MTEPVSAARSARESLAQGLAALQSPGLPEALLDAAAPIAQAMSSLHRIETTGGGALPEAAPHALAQLREALNLLQTRMPAHEAAERALEAVARSLSTVHALSESAAAPRAAGPTNTSPAPAPADPALAGTVALAPAAQASAPPPTQASPTATTPTLAATAYHPDPSAQAGAPQAAQFAPQAGHVAPQAAYAAPQANYASQTAVPAAQPAAYAQTEVQAPPPQAAAPAAGPAPYHPPPQQAYAPPAQQATVAAAPPATVPGAAAPTAAAPAPGRTTALRVEAELGAHSSSNFYKGLSSNDIIESGGIFVATYQIPDVGSEVLIKVSMPGGYEFEALGNVAWTREAPLSGMDAPPGFGARFIDISPEGRQLVYRYVRNREPLFHDDF
ncbi:MAG TPA: hypothetical protein VKZ49_13695 [Polyangiaceae bacterium]|nr:hypothetical protein [Polyangiaceae bacterium]